MEMPPNPFDRIGIGRIFWKTMKAKLSLHVSQTLANQPAAMKRCIVADHRNRVIATLPTAKVRKVIDQQLGVAANVQLGHL